MKHTGISRDVRFTRWVFRAYLLLLFLVPLPLGSNRPQFWSILVAVITVIALAWVSGWLLGVARWPHAIRRAKWPLIALLIFMVWVGLQLVSGSLLPEIFIPVYLNDAFGFVDGQARLSADIHATADSLLLTIGLVLLAILTVLLVRSRRRALQVLYVLSLAGLVQALYGSLMLLSGAEFGFFEAKRHGLGVATGTFINRNHYANLLVLSLSAGIGLLLAQTNLRGAQNIRQRMVSFLQATLGPKARLRIFMIIMVIALVLTRSRMGNVAFFTALTLVGFFALWRLQKPSRPLVVLMISVLVIDFFVVGTWFGIDQVIDRIQKTVQVEQDDWLAHDRNRIDADLESLRIIAKAPATGMGGGSFYTVYPAWRGDDQRFMDHTHNDYLEFTVEYGLVSAVLLAWFLILCFRRASQGLENRDKAEQFGISFASMMAMMAMMVHASVDFSLQIPANAAWFVVLGMLPFCVEYHRSNTTVTEQVKNS